MFNCSFPVACSEFVLSFSFLFRPTGFPFSVSETCFSVSTVSGFRVWGQTVFKFSGYFGYLGFWPKRFLLVSANGFPRSSARFFGFRKRFLCGLRERFFVFSVPRSGHMGFPVFRFPRQPKTVFRGFRFLVKMGFQWVAKRVFGFLVSAKWVFSVKRVFMLLKPFGALKPPETVL